MTRLGVAGNLLVAKSEEKEVRDVGLCTEATGKMGPTRSVVLERDESRAGRRQSRPAGKICNSWRCTIFQKSMYLGENDPSLAIRRVQS